MFPDAEWKFFLDADREVRARRRVKELEEKGLPVDPEAIRAAEREREADERGRPVGALRPAPDAIRVDTTHCAVGAVVDQLARRIQGTS